MLLHRSNFFSTGMYSYTTSVSLKYKKKKKKRNVVYSPCPFESYSIGMKFNLSKLIILYLDTFAFTFADLSIGKGLKDFLYILKYIALNMQFAFIYNIEGNNFRHIQKSVSEWSYDVSNF